MQDLHRPARAATDSGHSSAALVWSAPAKFVHLLAGRTCWWQPPCEAQSSIDTSKLASAGGNEQPAALDHDFSANSCVPSVKLLMDTPSGEDATMPSRWYSGQAVVHIKDQALQPSTPPRHSAELLTTLQLENREDVKVRTQCVVYICPYACTISEPCRTVCVCVVSCLHICGRCVHRMWRKSQLHGHTDLRGARRYCSSRQTADRIATARSWPRSWRTSAGHWSWTC